jgi:hypothetical protein
MFISVSSPVAAKIYIWHNVQFAWRTALCLPQNLAPNRLPPLGAVSCLEHRSASNTRLYAPSTPLCWASLVSRIQKSFVATHKRHVLPICNPERWLRTSGSPGSPGLLLGCTMNIMAQKPIRIGLVLLYMQQQDLRDIIKRSTFKSKAQATRGKTMDVRMACALAFEKRAPGCWRRSNYTRWNKLVTAQVNSNVLAYAVRLRSLVIDY